MDSLLIIDIPDFLVEYEADVQYGYSSERSKGNLRSVLEKASRGYCMYCYRRIVVDGIGTGHLEHAVEKDYSPKLEQCVPNIGIACSKCNLSYKKKEQQSRIIPDDEIQIFEEGNCKLNCTVPCSKYLRIKSVYLKNRTAHIILQPGGVWGEDSGNPLRLQYDVLQSKFQPSNKYEYSEQEIEFIEDHIRRFRLNGEREKTKQLTAFLKDTIDHEGFYTNMEYNHYIVELFVNRLEGKTREEILKICESLYIKAVMKFQGQ
ncbi:MAG: hypothetical protein HFG34_07335 [Eubacterium sp.]|nr:hypothetical protein [Eubacterium sp.]